jgi:hypothetical protein
VTVTLAWHDEMITGVASGPSAATTRLRSVGERTGSGRFGARWHKRGPGSSSGGARRSQSPRSELPPLENTRSGSHHRGTDVRRCGGHLA